MRTLSPKALLAALNPSPVFEVVGTFAERLALKSDEAWPSEIDGPHNFAMSNCIGQMTSCFDEDRASRSQTSESSSWQV